MHLRSHHPGLYFLLRLTSRFADNTAPEVPGFSLSMSIRHEYLVRHGERFQRFELPTPTPTGGNNPTGFNIPRVFLRAPNVDLVSESGDRRTVPMDGLAEIF